MGLPSAGQDVHLVNLQPHRAPHQVACVTCLTLGMGGKVGSTLAIDFPSGPVS